MPYLFLCSCLCSRAHMTHPKHNRAHNLECLHFSPMKQHIYCRSVVSSTHHVDQIASRSSKRNQYSVQEKIRILRVVENMVEQHHVTYAEAASAVTIDHSMISCWRKQEGAFGSVKRPDMLHLGSGPRSSLWTLNSTYWNSLKPGARRAFQ